MLIVIKDLYMRLGILCKVLCIFKSINIFVILKVGSLNEECVFFVLVVLSLIIILID